jgi:rubrerythrin
MDTYEYAMQMEKDGEAYYRELSSKSPHSGIKHILTMLADAEVIHYNIFRAMKNHEQVPPPESKRLVGIKNIFARLKEEGPGDIERSQVELYRKALDIEKRSRDFYLEKADESKDEIEKAIFLKVAHEEKKHYLIIENIIGFLNKPETWLENPEWYHLEEY